MYNVKFRICICKYGRMRRNQYLTAAVARRYGPGAAALVDDVFRVWPALTISTILAICGIIRLVFRSPAVYAVGNVVTALALGGTIPAFFLATGPVITSTNGQTYDSLLLDADSLLLGGIYPEGQLSLYLDQSESLNPETAFGKTYTEIFQLVYVSYYAWGALPFFYLLYKYIRSHNWRYSECRQTEDDVSERFETVSSDRYLTELKLYLCGWIGAYLMTFCINRAVPAKSPRLFLKDEYQHKLVGWGLATSLIGLATDDSSFGSFPSGHFSETLVCAFFAYRIFRKLGIATFIAAGGIAIATQVLRYHYFIDLLAGLAVVGAALFFGLNWSDNTYRRHIELSLAEYEERHGLTELGPSKKGDMDLARSDEQDENCGCVVELADDDDDGKPPPRRIVKFDSPTSIATAKSFLQVFRAEEDMVNVSLEDGFENGVVLRHI